MWPWDLMYSPVTLGLQWASERGYCGGHGVVLSSDPQELLWRCPERHLRKKKIQPVHLSLLGIIFQKLLKLHCSRGKLHLLIEERRRNNSKSYSVEANVAF